MDTVFVQRREGVIVGVFEGMPQPGVAEEELAADHPDVVAYRDPAPDLQEYLAAKRFAVETGGIVIPGDPPMPCWTDRATQAFLGRILDSLDRGFVTAPLKVKTPAGALLLSREQIDGISAAVAQHVQACFDLEADLAGAIAAETVTTTAEIDAAAWPPNT